MYYKTATWNPSDKIGSVVLSNGNLTALATAAVGHSGVRSTVGVSSGKWYWEVIYAAIGKGNYTQNQCVSPVTTILTDSPYNGNVYSYCAANGYKTCIGGTYVPYGSNWSTVGDVISTALDMDNGKLWWAKNGVWQASGNPVTGVNPACDGLSGTLYAMWKLVLIFQ